MKDEIIKLQQGEAIIQIIAKASFLFCVIAFIAIIMIVYTKQYDYKNLSLIKISIAVFISSGVVGYIFNMTGEGLTYSTFEKRFYLNDLNLNFEAQSPALTLYEGYNSNYKRKSLHIGAIMPQETFKAIQDSFGIEGNYTSREKSWTLFPDEVSPKHVFIYKIHNFSTLDEVNARNYLRKLAIKLNLEANQTIVSSEDSITINRIDGIKKSKPNKEKIAREKKFLEKFKMLKEKENANNKSN